MAIETGNAKPIKQRAYRAPLEKLKEIDQQIQEMLQAGVIEPSVSPWASPVLLMKKPTGKFRFCTDFRKLNKVTVRDQFPLPNIQEIFDQLWGYNQFSTLDLKSGYW
jgi:hypothetical protein